MLIGIEDPGRKAYRRGTHRLMAPAETLERVYRLAPAMGITRIANVTGLDRIGIPVAMVSRPNARSVSVSQGKGLDLAAAKASGLMEAVEGYHGEHIFADLKLGSYEDLRYSHNLVDVDTLPLLPEAAFHGHLPLLWIEGEDLLGVEPVWLPFELVHVDFTVGPRPGAGCFPGSSNGLASGNHLLEAISHGICEAVERDATARWGRLDDESRQRSHVDLETIDDADCLSVLEQYARTGISVGVWETTSEIGIPVFTCMILDADDDPRRTLYGGTGIGCHPARAIALLRALTEAAQSRLTMIAGARDDVALADYARVRSSEARAQLRTLIEGERPARRFADVPSWEGETFADDVAWELERLQAAGVQRVIAVDLTREAFQIPVVRIVIPGLEDLHSGGTARRRSEDRSLSSRAGEGDGGEATA